VVTRDRRPQGRPHGWSDRRRCRHFAVALSRNDDRRRQVRAGVL